MSSSTSSSPSHTSSSTSRRTSRSSSFSQSEIHRGLIGKQIRSQTYQFEPDVVARMLSPKLLRKNINYDKPHLSLNDFECLVDDPAVQSAVHDHQAQVRRLPRVAVELSQNKKGLPGTYDTVVAFLNNCVEECNKVYDEIHEKLKHADACGDGDGLFTVATRTERWFPAQFRFIRYDKETGDTIEDERPLKPGVIAVDGAQLQATETKLVSEKVNLTGWWGLPQPPMPSSEDTNSETRRHVQILVPVEIGSNWKKIIRQSGAYAQCQFAVSPLRTFTIGIGINYKTHKFRYFIFHHGGLSASTALKFNDPNAESDSVSIQKVLLSILLWQSAEDAGLPPFTDSRNFYLPNPFNEALRIGSVLYHSPSIRGRNTYVARLESAPNRNETLESKVPQSQIFQQHDTATAGQIDCQPEPEPDTRLTNGTKIHEPISKPKTGIPSSQKSQKATTDKVTVTAKTILPCEPERRQSLTAAHLEPLHTSFARASNPLSSNVVIKCYWPDTAVTETMESDMYKACDGEFGAPQAIISFRACFHENYPISNSIFLPTENHGEYRWWIFDYETPNAVEYRTLWVMVVANEGQSLVECLDASDLSQCLLHSMLGWLSAHSHGYLHRDISIGNLLKLKEPITSCNPPNVWGVVNLLLLRLSGQEKSDTGLEVSMDKATAFDLAANKPEWLELLKIVEELEDTLVQMQRDQVGSLTECRAIFTDGDLAAYVPIYLKENFEKQEGAIIGTNDFMSSELLSAMEVGSPYLQSPLDDLWSFFNTALWATFFNHHNLNPNNEVEEDSRALLRKGSRWRDSVARRMRRDVARKGSSFSLIVQQMAPLLRDWNKLLNEMTGQMSLKLYEIPENGGGEVDYLILFHKTAYTGVLEFVRELLKTDLLKQTKS